MVSGAPVRHTLVSCATNTAEGLTCIESVSVIVKPGDEPIVGKFTGKKYLLVAIVGSEIQSVQF